MAKLHEVLAVEKTLESTAKKLVQESARTLGKENLFSGFTKSFKMFDDNLAHLNQVENMKLETTVDENIDYVVPHIAKWYDAVLQKDATNQIARADIILPDGTKIAEGMPATFLLGLETKLTQLRELYVRIPTLAPGMQWVKDESNEKAGVFQTVTPQTSFKTEKDMDYRVVVEATEHHPAQIKEVQRTINIGQYEVTRTSGMLSPVEKARRLDNIDILIVAVRKARTRANDAKLVQAQVGTALMDFINK